MTPSRKNLSRKRHAFARHSHGRHPQLWTALRPKIFSPGPCFEESPCADDLLVFALDINARPSGAIVVPRNRMITHYERRPERQAVPTVEDYRPVPAKNRIGLVVPIQANADQFHPERNLTASYKRKQNAFAGGKPGWRAHKRVLLVLHHLKDGVLTRPENDHSRPRLTPQAPV